MNLITKYFAPINKSFLNKVEKEIIHHLKAVSITVKRGDMKEYSPGSYVFSRKFIKDTGKLNPVKIFLNIDPLGNIKVHNLYKVIAPKTLYVHNLKMHPDDLNTFKSMINEGIYVNTYEDKGYFEKYLEKINSTIHISELGLENDELYISWLNAKIAVDAATVNNKLRDKAVVFLKENNIAFSDDILNHLLINKVQINDLIKMELM